ncbi:beta-1 adrenergic receptor-like [Orbicella faveolata]|uniref:beta-1 adrenergic receptor-like n=1 Tax=Orbicella faveolata TaxID=48498 RepID=UPI0009E45667|nr:beta-1 adrenergic receptor-like [Orbicella faveolata]
MNITTAAATNSSENATGSSRSVPSKAEAVALCAAFILSFVFIVVGNLLTLVLFTVNRSLYKKSLFLVINMAFADLMLGILSLPIYIYNVGRSFQLWNGGWSMSLSIFYKIVDTFFSQASLISAAFISGERFYAIHWPFKHRTLSMRAYRIMIFTVWALTLLIATLWSTSFFLISYKRAVHVWTPYVLILIFIICGCNIGIWRRFRRGSIASQQQNRDSLNKRLTKTLMFVSFLVSLSWLPLVIFNCLIYVFDVQIPLKYYLLVNVINYSNSFANPVVYALRIPEFREALALCCLRRPAASNIEIKLSRNQKTLALTPATELRTPRTETSDLQLAFEQEVMETEL